MCPAQFPRRRGNWVGPGKSKHITQLRIAHAQIFGESEKDLLSVLGPFLMKQNVLVNELPGLPRLTDLSCATACWTRFRLSVRTSLIAATS